MRNPLLAYRVDKGMVKVERLKEGKTIKEPVGRQEIRVMMKKVGGDEMWRIVRSRKGKDKEAAERAKKRRKTIPGTTNWGQGGRGNTRENITEKVVMVKTGREATEATVEKGLRMWTGREKVVGTRKRGRRVGGPKVWDFKMMDGKGKTVKKRRKKGIG